MCAISFANQKEVRDLSYPHLTLVIGGAASGKSDFAERLADAADLNKIYVATANAFDSEMHDKILQHQKIRGQEWTTIETLTHLPEILKNLQSDQVVLVECLTMWLSNLIMAGDEIERSKNNLIEILITTTCFVVLVTNEIGMSIVPDTTLGRLFRNEQGQLNREVAAVCDCVVQVVAGCPIVLRGELPELKS